MDRSVSPNAAAGGHKVAQIANRFQASSGSSNCSSGDDATPKRQPTVATSPHGPSSASPKDGGTTGVPVVRTESHAARFNNARALFEKLGTRPAPAAATVAVNGKMSKDTVNGGSSGGGGVVVSATGGASTDTKRDSSPDKLISNGLRNGSTSTNGLSSAPYNGRSTDSNVQQQQTMGSPATGTKIFNVSRPKPEKPERKFNSRELIEKQKNWTSHFSKVRSSPKYNSDPNRCDIIRTVPAPQAIATNKPTITTGNNSTSPGNAPDLVVASPPVPIRQHVSFDSSVPITRGSRNNNSHSNNNDDDIPPCPPIRQNSIPEIKPRSIKPVIVGATANVNGSPVKIMVKRSPDASPEKMQAEVLLSGGWGDQQQTVMKDDDLPEGVRKKSFDLIAEESVTGLGRSRSQSLDKENVISPGIGLSSSSSPMASISSEPTSPIHTEDEKQENEANEKTDLGLMTPTDGIDKSEGTDSGRGSNNQTDNDAATPQQISTKKVSSICFNMPAVGLGVRPPSIISTSTDEGGFNEPSPEIKAKLKPAYTFEPEQHSTQSQQESVDLHYVDVRHRLNPDGSEGENSYIEPEMYSKSAMVMDLERSSPSSRRGSSSERVVYATIKPEVPPPTELYDSVKNEMASGSDESSLYVSTVYHHSPQSILDPTRPTLATASSGSSRQDSIEEKRLPDLPVEPTPPPRPPLPKGPPLDVTDDVEYVDASDNEAGEERPLNGLQTPQQSGRKDESICSGGNTTIPESMTADEAERLLSSRILESKIRQQSLLSDEEAREVEALLKGDASTLVNSVSEIAADQSLHNTSTLPLHESLISRSSVTAPPEESTAAMLSGITDLNSTTQSETALDRTGGEEEEEESPVGSRRVSLQGSEDGGNNDSQRSGSYPVAEYPPVQVREVFVEAGVHYYEDGNFWMEVPGLNDADEIDEDDHFDYTPYAKLNKVKFSTSPIRVFSTFSVNEYDRRNEDVDPVTASAEYELEKRVEKMDVFPVELLKGAEGLGLSIIGMGVGADAGLEKLGIFVKTITDNGAAARDGRIQVNDQIIEVDGKSLVGVTQAYAASVLRNTSGPVKFQIGREKDPQNSEVAQLIRQSLQADREMEERRQRQQEELYRRTSEHSEDSTLPASANSSVSEGPMSPTANAMESLFEAEATHSQEVESLKRLLQESQNRGFDIERELFILKDKLLKLESTGNESELLKERLRQTERELTAVKKESGNYQSMMQQSQLQYVSLDKKYGKAKKIIRDFKQRELELLHREEFYVQCLQEKDSEYNALVKKLKDRVINLEHELEMTQRRAGLPVALPYDSTSLKLTPQMTRRSPPKPLFHKLDTDLSDTEVSDLSPDAADAEKTATVERKIPSSSSSAARNASTTNGNGEEVVGTVPPTVTNSEGPVTNGSVPKQDSFEAVPATQHELFENPINTSKSELASDRQLPVKKSLSNSGSEAGGRSVCESLGDDQVFENERGNEKEVEEDEDEEILIVETVTVDEEDENDNGNTTLDVALVSDQSNDHRKDERMQLEITESAFVPYDSKVVDEEYEQELYREKSISPETISNATENALYQEIPMVRANLKGPSPPQSQVPQYTDDYAEPQLVITSPQPSTHSSIASSSLASSAATTGPGASSVPISTNGSPLYAQVHKEPRTEIQKIHSTIPNTFKNDNMGCILTTFGTKTPSMTSFGGGGTPMSSLGTNAGSRTHLSAASYSHDLNRSKDSVLGSLDMLSDSGNHSDSWMYPQGAGGGGGGSGAVAGIRKKGSRGGPPSSFTDQLNQVLADRERRFGGGENASIISTPTSLRTGGSTSVASSSRESLDDYAELEDHQQHHRRRSSNPTAIMTQNLLVEIRQAVYEAQPKVKHVIPQSLSPPGSGPWQHHHHQQQPHSTPGSLSQGTTSPGSMSSGSTSPSAYSPSRTLDLSGSSTSFSSEYHRKVAAGPSHNWQNGPVHQWSKEQVCHWLMGLGLDHHTAKFIECGVEGGALLQLDSRDFKILGVTGDDKQKLKKHLKALKAIVEKERKQMEKNRKMYEKQVKKAEKKEGKKK